MTTPLYCLLGFAVWTLVVLMTTIGLHRWTQILTGKASIDAFRADHPEGPDWYRRAMRAHANCVENLPVFGAIVAVATFAGASSPLLSGLSIAVVAARVCQTTVHVAFTQNARAVSVRFSFFAIQLVAMLTMAFVIATR
jgi:uncharacterized MAPEG superfamily protein